MVLQSCLAEIFRKGGLQAAAAYPGRRVHTYSPVQDRLCDDAGFWHGRHWHQFEIPLPNVRGE